MLWGLNGKHVLTAPFRLPFELRSETRSSFFLTAFYVDLPMFFFVGAIVLYQVFSHVSCSAGCLQLSVGSLWTSCGGGFFQASG